MVGKIVKVLMVVPAYNEKDNIPKLLEELRSKSNIADYIIINDCSQDETLAILKKEQAKYINLSVNLGIGGAVQTGYQYGVLEEYEIVVQVDGDGQHDIGYIEELLKPIYNGTADITIGSRFVEKEGFQSSVFRRIGIKFLSWLVKICCGIKVYDVTSGFRAVSGKYLNMFAEDYPIDYPEPESIVAASLAGARIQEVPVIMRERNGGISSISPIKSIYYMIKVSLAIIGCRILR